MASSTATWRDYLELTKPKVVLLILLTAIVGMYMAPSETVPLKILIIATVGIGFAAGGAAVVNHVVDQKIDAKMARTFKRPVATGKINNTKAVIIATLDPEAPKTSKLNKLYDPSEILDTGSFKIHARPKTDAITIIIR